MEIAMNHEQFLQWRNKEKTTLDIQLENMNIRLINSKKLKKQIVVSIATALFILNNPIRVMAVDLGAIDKLGNTFLVIIQRVGYWIALAAALTEIIRAGMKAGNSTSEIGKIILHYLLLFASLYLMPYLFNMVAEAFR